MNMVIEFSIKMNFSTLTKYYQINFLRILSILIFKCSLFVSGT